MFEVYHSLHISFEMPLHNILAYQYDVVLVGEDILLKNGANDMINHKVREVNIYYLRG